jgi:hypothetical protein
MKTGWGWGTGITIVIIIFVALCAVFLVFAFNQRIVLTEQDYYPKELRHEEKLVKMRNANALSGPLECSATPSGILIVFPRDFRGKKLTGQVHLYRPSDEGLDQIVPVATDTALQMTIPAQRLRYGKYLLKAEWTCEGTEYYVERELFVP